MRPHGKTRLGNEMIVATPQSGTDITTFGEGEKFRIASKLSSELRAANSMWAVAQALHTNLAADVAKLGEWCCARTGTPKLV